MARPHAARPRRPATIQAPSRAPIGQPPRHVIRPPASPLNAAILIKHPHGPRTDRARAHSVHAAPSGSTSRRRQGSATMSQPTTQPIHRSIPEKPGLDGLEVKWSTRWETQRICAFDRAALRGARSRDARASLVVLRRLCGMGEKPRAGWRCARLLRAPRAGCIPVRVAALVRAIPAVRRGRVLVMVANGIDPSFGVARRRIAADARRSGRGRCDERRRFRCTA